VTCAKLSTRIPGGNHHAVQNADGTWDILDVPILAEMRKGEKGAHEDLGRDWLEQVKANMLTLAVNGQHMKRVHIGHHELFRKPEPAGFFLPSSVREIEHKGRKVWALFATLKNIPDRIFRMIEKAELPYRSVEVRSWKNAELSSLALMDTEDPYWEFPMLTIGTKAEAKKTVDIAEPALAMACHGDAGAILLRFQEADMDPVDEKKGPEGDETSGKDAKSGGNGIEAVLAKLAAGQEALLGLLQKLVSGLPTVTKTPEDAKPPDQRDMAEVNGLGKQAIKLAAQDAARIDQLESKVEAIAEEKRVAGIVEKAKSDLKGWHLSTATLARIVKLASSDKTGANLAEFVEEYKASVPKEPPRNASELESMGSVKDLPEVLKFGEQGPEALSAARRLSAAYDELSKRGRVSSMSRERFITLNIAAERGEAHRLTVAGK